MGHPLPAVCLTRTWKLTRKRQETVWFANPSGRAVLEADGRASRPVSPQCLPASCRQAGDRRNHLGSVWAHSHPTWQTWAPPGRATRKGPRCILTQHTPHSRGISEQRAPQWCALPIWCWSPEDIGHKFSIITVFTFGTEDSWKHTHKFNIVRDGRITWTPNNFFINYSSGKTKNL